MPPIVQDQSQWETMIWWQNGKPKKNYQREKQIGGKPFSNKQSIIVKRIIQI